MNSPELVRGKAGLLVFTMVFPNSAQPGLGLFVRERMFRVGRIRPIVVVAPVPWFPLQGLIRRWRPNFRLMPPNREIQNGFEVYHPRFFSVPGILKWLDGISMALASAGMIRRLHKTHGFGVIDSHFAYPDGYAAVLLGHWLNLPVCLTLRGTEVSLSCHPWRRRLIVAAVNRAQRVFTVADSLKQHMARLGARTDHILHVGNGVDGDWFKPEDPMEARRRFDLPEQAKVIISVGGLCERKGFHRVIEQMPRLLQLHPNLYFLIAGGPSPEGDWSERLRTQTNKLGLSERVRFLGYIPREEIRWPLSAADLFVLATRNEGWANVLLEAMACGLPVITTDVGGNREVVSGSELGFITPFGDGDALRQAMDTGLNRTWDRVAILNYARANDWPHRILALDRDFARLLNEVDVSRDMDDVCQ